MKRLLLLTLFLPISSFALILIDDTMSRKEQNITGVANLNHNQRAALELWLNNNFVLKTEDQKQKVPQLNLAENINNGQRLKLSDGSVYEIAPPDINKASGWITPFPIEISPSGDPNFPYLLINMNTKSTLRARRVVAANP